MGPSCKIGRRFTKNEIIAMYLNIYDLATKLTELVSSKIYFNKKPSDLLLEESATFSGMLKNSSHNPREDLS